MVSSEDLNIKVVQLELEVSTLVRKFTEETGFVPIVHVSCTSSFRKPIAWAEIKELQRI